MTHSPILAELLRPTGSHGHGVLFLKHFLNQIGNTIFDPNGATVGEEVSFPDIGRIDIVLTDRLGNRILVENKIGASLQERQLERYQSAYPNAWVLYLTLDGSKPNGTDLKCVPNLRLLSYRRDIVAWLDVCQTSCAKSPTVYHAISQYRTLVAMLTQINLSMNMTKKMADVILSSAESFRAFSALVQTKQEVHRQLAEKLGAAIQPYAKRLGFRNNLVGAGIGYKDALSRRVELPGGLTLDAEFSFESAEFRDCYFGFRLQDGLLNDSSRDLLCQIFETEFGQKPTRHSTWPCWTFWHTRHWDDLVWAKVLSNEVDELARDIGSTLERLNAVLRTFEAALSDRRSVPTGKLRVPPTRG